jgi:ABC-type lipoprotein release transport system permease subunit
VTGDSVAMMTLAALVMALVAALLPAHYLARLDPATAFRR